MTIRYTLDSRIASIREVRPTLSARKRDPSNPNSEVDVNHGPTEWHIVTEPPSPLAFSTRSKPPPYVKVGRRVRLSIDIVDVDDEQW